MPVMIPSFEKDYPVGCQIHHDFIDAPDEFQPLIVVGPKGAIIDFVRLRFGVAAGETSVATLRKCNDGTAPDGSGTAVSASGGTVNMNATADTSYSFVISPTANILAPYQLLYFQTSAVGSVVNVVVTVGWRPLHN